MQEKLDQPVIELSNGEGKRVQLAQALLLQPQLMVLDQPFIGLDVQTRQQLHQLITKLKNEGITIVLVSSPEEIPACTDRVFLFEEGKLSGIVIPNELIVHKENHLKAIKDEIEWKEIERLSPVANVAFENAVYMSNVNICFEDKVILDDVSWTVKKGEHWALIGHNGSGKSTLLSLINADNPQVYLNDVQLFDQKRGGGESIWEIKKKIGYVSPEMHVFFQRTSSYVESISLSANDYTLDGFSQEQTSCYEAICSGFNDQMGSSATITYNQHSLVLHWLEALELKKLQDKPFYKASLGEQRVLLLIRSLIKNPPLLLLDEPCQGLDKYQTQRFTSIVDNICRHFNKTLIYVSHYSSEMPSCIDHQLILEKGSIKEIF
ncbi:putative ABC transporter ATP-binding protein YlmA [compost metagenome]